MIDHLRPYPSYRDSRLPWLGKIPEHWLVERVKNRVQNVIEQTTGCAAGDVYIALEHVQSWTGHVRAQRSDFPFDSQVKRFRVGDVLFGKLRPYLAKVARPETNGVCVSEFFVLRPQDDTVRAPFLEQVLRSKPIIDVVNSSTFGAKMPRADWNFFGNVALPFPPRDEQAAIVRFLDHFDRRIRRYIRAKRQLIALLNEQKQAIIHRAVTRGLDPNVRLKPSGIEWLGDVPEHWKHVRLKNVARVQTGITLGKRYGDVSLETKPYLRVANVQTARLALGTVKTVAVPASEIAGSELKPGDVLMTEGGDIDKLGRGCVWRGEIEGCLHQNHVFAVRPDQEQLLPDFLVLLMASSYGRSYFEITAKRTTNLASTNSTTLGMFPLVLPSVAEQREILDVVAGETSTLDVAVKHAECEIALLHEYRTRLIADVVTGKLDVREAAARLPDEGDADGEIAEDLLEDDEPVDDAELNADAEEVEA